MIRRFLLFLLLIAFVFVANAQSVILSEGFNDGQLPTGWTIIDHDGDGYNWDASSWHGITTEVFSGQGMIASASYMYGVGALAPDNWLISPAIVVPDYAALSFYIKSQDEIYADEHYSVYVSQVNTIEGFLENPAVLTGVSTSEWDWKTVDLGDYAGETVYIAFRHHNSSDMYWLDVDEVSVVGGTNPFILTNTDTVHCGIVALGDSSINHIPVRAFGLSSPINVSVAAPFKLSADNVTYANTAILNSTGGSLYIKYTPVVTGMVETPLVLSATGAVSQQVEVVGIGVECNGINEFPWTESFAMVPPPCWNLIPQEDTTWTSLHYMGSWWASCIGSVNFKTEQLETDVFDFSSAIHPAMSFSFMTQPYYVENDYVDLKVYVSLDGGSTYSAQSIWKLSQYGSFEAWMPTEACIDMLSLAGEASVKFKFSYEGSACQLLFNDLAVIDLPAVYSDHVIYVKADAEGDGTGSSWVNAMRDLKTALRMASYIDTVQLWVAAGSYYGDTAQTADNAFVMLKDVDVYGGFVGNEPADYNLSQRDLAANVTVLDGMNVRRVLYQPSDFSNETVWDGFTIQNGRVEGNGAGTYLRENGVLSHCKISHNMAGHGGGIFAERGSTVYNCLISNNEALYNGGGLYMNHSTIEVANSTIVRNLAEGNGSGVYGFGGNLRNCIVWGNKKSQNLSDNIEGLGMIVYNSAVEGGYAGEANIALGDFYNNPMFASPSNVAGDADTTAHVDWHLQNGSVCVNRGDNVVVTDSYDLDGTTRIKLDTVDMGCYESPFYSVPTSGCVYQTVNFSVDTCDLYIWNGRTYTQSGDYTQTFMNASGCDSVVTMHLTVNYTNYGDTIAVACDSFDWYEHTGLTQSCDNLTHTFTNAAGCDSIVTLHLTVNYTNYGDTIAVACDSFDWYEHTGITQSCDNLTHTFTNAAGCDSIVTLHLTVNYTTYGDTSAVACDSYDWYEHAGITQSCDNLTHTFTNALGCDSIVTLHLTVNYTNYGDTTAVACDSFDWYEHTGLTQSCDNLTHTFTNALGCDSIVTLHLTVNYTNYGDTTAVACDSFDWYEHTGITQSCENLTHTFTNAAGCDSIVTLHLTVNYTNYGDTTAVACDSFDWYEHTGITQSCDNLTHTFTNALGCDSIVTLHLTVNYTNYGDTIAVTCDSFDWYEHTGITQSCENLTHTFTNALGCDSIVTLHLTVNYTTYGDTIVVACDSFDWYEHTGITHSCENLKHTFTNALGCDSIVTLHLTVNYTNYGDTVATACDSFDWYEHTGITQSCDNLTHTFTNALGCDSIVTLHLTVYPSYNVMDTQTVCENALPYTWNGKTFTGAGTMIATLESSHHCDSVVVMTLNVDAKYEQNEFLTICQSELPYTWRDTLFEEGTVSNDYVFYRTSTKECDSIVTLHLTVNLTTYGDTVVTACDSFDWYEHVGITQSCENLTHTFTNAMGCDSIVTLHLTVNYTNYGDTIAIACDSFDWYEHTGITQSCDNLTHTFTNALGCDSIVTLHLTVNYTNYGDTVAVACDSFDWYEHTGIMQSCDNLTHTFTNALGCDSIVTLHLTVNYTNYGDTIAVACDSFDWYEHTGITQSCENLTHTFTNALGCDSIVTLHLTVNYTNYGDTIAVACDSFDWYEHTGITQSCDNLTHTFTNALGCDSIVTLHLTVNHTNYGDTIAIACDSFDWYEHTGITQSCENLTHTFTNAVGCDSIVTLHLTVNYTNYGDTIAIACDSFNWYEHTGITQSCDNLTHTFTNALGCDSIVTLHLTVNYTNYGDTIAVACDSFDWYEHTGITQSCDNLTHTFTNALGCDSIVTLHLTVNYTNYGDTIAVACDSFDWYEHTGITQSCENLTHAFTNAAGCDSIVTLHLTVNYTTYGDTIAVACDSFDWYEHVGITQSCENLTHTFTNVLGCDSIVTLHLTVNYTTYGDTTAVACDSFDWYEHTGITQSCDNLTHTFTNALGCDSIVTLHLTVNYTNYCDTIAIACDSFDWYEHTGITQSCDNLTHTFTNALGCDSIVTLHLTVNYTNYGDTTAVACDSFDWYEHTGITQSCENLTHTFTNAAGCDSIVTLHLTVNYTTYGDTIAIACDSFDWYEHTGITQSCDNLTHTFTNAAGCDSIVTLHLTVNYTNYGDTIAVACDSFDWYEHTGITQSCENLTHTFTNALGCDSIVTLHLTVNYTNYGDTIAVACDSFDWYEHTGITQSCDNLTHTFTNALGCDSIVTLHLTVNYTNYGDTIAVACDSFDWYEHTGIAQSCENLTHTFTNAVGCDSIVTLHLTVNYTNYGDTIAVACDSFDWYEHTDITQSCDNLTHTFTNALGCDSIVTLHLTVNYTNYGDTVATACDSFNWYEHTGITQSCENLTHTFTNAVGCDSIVTLHLTVNYTTYGDTIATACDSFDWYEHVGITQSCENLTHTFTNALGCDSVVTLHLTVGHSNTGDTTAFACDSFTWYGTTYTETPEVAPTHTFTNASGCDSVVTLYLTIGHSNTGDTIAFACDSFTWYGTIYTETPAVAPTHTFTNASGCDSVVTLYLTIGHSNTGDTTAFACNSFTWYGTTYTETPAVAPTHTFTNASGCDSVVTLYLTIGHSNTGDTTAFACNSFTWYGTTYTETPDVAPTHTFTNATGCDSVVTLHLNIGHSNTGDTIAHACDSFTWYGTTYTETPDVAPTHTFTNASGCDSVVTLHLTIGYSNTGDTIAFACDNFTWYGTTYTETPEVAPTHTFTNASGCDSVVTLHLTVHHTVYGDTTATACDSFTWNDSVYTESGDYIQVFPAANGCDSVVTLHLTINYSVTEHISATACENYTWGGVTYTESGDYPQVFPGANDCDFVVILHLTINNPVTELVEASACDSYTWNDETYTESGDYIQIFSAANGCDSVVTLHLTINNSLEELVEVSACENYTWNDSVYTESGDYTLAFTAANGCDSVVTLRLTINYPEADSVEVTACDSYTWNDSVYTVSGDYTQTLTATTGCDSVVTMHLTINSSVAEFFETFACDSFTWNEETYTESGDYIQTFPAANGCDSVVTLHLTIHESVLIDAYLTIQESDLPYTYGDTTFEPGTVQSGDYVFNFTTADGCDSIIVLHLTVETGVPNHIIASDMRVYPNPTTGKLFVEFDEVSMNTQLQVYDIYGKLIMQYTIKDRHTELNIGHLANGVYLLRMVDGNSSSKMVKVVKQ